MCHPVPSSPTILPVTCETRPKATVDAVKTRMAGNSASAPEAARPRTGINPKNGHRPLVQIGFVATTDTARASSSGGAAMNVGADGTRPKRPPQTKARTSGFFAAQDSSSGRRAVGARQRRRGGRRGCTNALTLILDHTRGPQIIMRRQERHFVLSIRAVGTAVDAAVPVTSPSGSVPVQCGTDHTLSYEVVALRRRQRALMRLIPDVQRLVASFYWPPQLARPSVTRALALYQGARFFARMQTSQPTHIWPFHCAPSSPAACAVRSPAPPA